MFIVISREPRTLPDTSTQKSICLMMTERTAFCGFCEFFFKFTLYVKYDYIVNYSAMLNSETQWN